MAAMEMKNEMMNEQKMNGELSEEMLDDVDGGIAVATAGALLLWGAGTCCAASAYKCWAAYRTRRR